MKKKIFSILPILAILILSFVTPSVHTFANEPETGMPDPGYKFYAYDDAYLLNDEEFINADTLLAQISESAGIDILFITTDSLGGRTDKRYLEDLYDFLYFDKGLVAYDAALILINMEDRIITIQGYGSCERYLNGERIEYMLDNIQPMIKRGEYYDAAIEFAMEAEFYEDNEDFNVFYGGIKRTPMYLANMFTFAIIALVVGLITIIIMKKNAGGKVTVNQATYLDPNSRGITNGYDHYVRTTVTKTRRVESSGSGGGSGSGRSSGGRSHSGGSRGF